MDKEEDIYESDRLMDKHDFVESEITGDEGEPTYPEDDEDSGKDDEEGGRGLPFSPALAWIKQSEKKWTVS